jgi:hypothetical protein
VTAAPLVEGLRVGRPPFYSKAVSRRGLRDFTQYLHPRYPGVHSHGPTGFACEPQTRTERLADERGDAGACTHTGGCTCHPREGGRASDPHSPHNAAGDNPFLAWPARTTPLTRPSLRLDGSRTFLDLNCRRLCV